MRKIFFAGFFILVSLTISLNLFSQITITGPTCVVPGVVYQYKISGAWDSLSTMQVCVAGGVIADSLAQNNCTQTGAPLSAVLIIWRDTSGSSLTVTTSIGNKTLPATTTSNLSPGSVDSVSKTQSILFDSIPKGINCSLSDGGSCSPSYLYQWQQSTDMLSWSDIDSATGQNLSFSTPLIQSSFYRRKVIESSSGSLAYSDIATVNVFWQMPVTDSSSVNRINKIGTPVLQYALLNESGTKNIQRGIVYLDARKNPEQNLVLCRPFPKTGTMN